MGDIHAAATAGIITNVIFGILSILAVMILVPADAGKGSKRSTPVPTPIKKPVTEKLVE